MIQETIQNIWIKEALYMITKTEMVLVLMSDE